MIARSPMRNFMMGMIMATGMALGCAQAQAQPFPADDDPCADQCYQVWPNCLDSLSHFFGICLDAQPGFLCEMLFYRQLPYCWLSRVTCAEQCPEPEE